jgi:hypothetical protein
MKRKLLTETPVCPRECLVIISYTTGLYFALERIGPLAAIVITVFYLLALYLFALPNTPENPFASIYSESLIKTTCEHLLLLSLGSTLLFIECTMIHPLYLWVIKIIHEVKVRRLKGVFLKLDFQKAYDHLDWAFLRQALIRRGFDDRMISWIMQIVMSGNTDININGEVGPYFRSSCGVRQGGPISPCFLTPQWTS